MGAAIRAFDWTATPLGTPAGWPPTLKTAVALVLASRFPKCIVWGEGLITIYNDAFRPILGNKPEALGRPFNEVWAEVWDQVRPLVEAAFAGESTFLEDCPFEINRHGWPEETWFTFCYSPLRDEHGRVVGMMDTVIETTGKVVAERQSALLNQELAHRMKNILSVVQAIASQTFGNATEMDQAHRTFEGRLIALANAHNIVTNSSKAGSTLDRVVEAVLRPLVPSPARLRFEGPPVELGSRQALSFALALHELATNAAKYGALSVPDGVVAVNWKAGEPGSADRFSFSWVEQGGPPVVPPHRQGFGSKLITRVLPHDLKGTADIAYNADGITFRLSCPIARLADPVAGNG